MEDFIKRAITEPKKGSDKAIDMEKNGDFLKKKTKETIEAERFADDVFYLETSFKEQNTFDLMMTGKQNLMSY